MFSLWSHHRREPELAVDFGTARLRAGAADGGSFLEEPSHAGTRPALRCGVVADTGAATAVLERAFARLGIRHGNAVLACAPSDATEADQARLTRALHAAGAARTAIVPEPVAALIGAGADIGTDGAYLLVDLGEGVVDCALIKERRLFASATWRGGCCALRATVATCLREALGLETGEAEAERILRRIGVEGHETFLPIRGKLGGRDVMPLVSSALLHTALRPLTTQITQTILGLVHRLEPELCAEAISNGVTLTGGGVLIPGLAAACARETHLPLRPAPRPLESVIAGACSLLETTTRLDLWDSLHTFWPPGTVNS